MTDHPTTTHHDSDVRRAWWSLTLFIPSLVGAFLVGEGLVSALGYGNEDTVPTWVALLAGTPAILVFALPLGVVHHFGRRAVARGDRDGKVPEIVAWAVAGGFVAVNLLQLAARLVL